MHVNLTFHSESVIGEQCHVLTRLHIDIWDANFEDSIDELTCNVTSSSNKEEIGKKKTEPVIPYFRSLQDVKIKCESYVEYLPPSLFDYIFGCLGQLSIVQVTKILKCLNGKKKF